MIKSRQFKHLHASASPAEFVQGPAAEPRSAPNPSPDDHRYKRPATLQAEGAAYTALGRQQCRLASRRVACMAHLAQRDAALIIHGVSR
ncbi:hypothetical protein BWU74_25015 [Paraburkholderia caledonica]|nr:hypothetical protein BWU74_25015 [Burkholderia sp. Bk]